MHKNQKTYNILVGLRGSEFYVLEYTFDYGDGFKGAVGSIHVPISRDEYDYRTSIEGVAERYEDVWRDMVANGKETRGLDDFVKDIINSDGDEAVFELSSLDVVKQIRDKTGYTEDEYPVFEYIGGGRCFYSDDGFDEIYEPKLLKLIRDIERPEPKKEGV
jgi:hypothetical protein